MSTFFRRHAWTLEVNRNMVDVTCGVPTADHSWVFVDVNGHEHSYRAGYESSMRYVVDESHWCDGTEGIALHDPHLAVDRSHWECLACGVTVKPGMDPPYTPKQIAGSWSAELSGVRSDGMKVIVSLDTGELAELQGAAEADFDVVALRIADASQRVIHRSSGR